MTTPKKCGEVEGQAFHHRFEAREAAQEFAGRVVPHKGHWHAQPSGVITRAPNGPRGARQTTP